VEDHSGTQSARNFKDLRMKMSPERRARVEERVQNAIKEMALVELRSAREFTQAAPCFRMGRVKIKQFQDAP
jgi:hypothetical protein